MKGKVMALVLATLLFSFSFIPFDAQASDNILRIVQGYTRTSLYNAYEALGSNQKEICDYLVGCYNATYLGARGFNFAPGEITDASSLSQVFRLLGGKVMQNTNISLWGSRMSDVFCNYVSSCILYASEIPTSTSFNTWFNSLPQDFSIPYNKDMYDAWNNYYNDISNDGIIGSYVEPSPWDSGDLKDFPYPGVPYYNSANQTDYNNFIVNYSPVIFSREVSGRTRMAGFAGVDPPNTLIILRGNVYDYFRYGRYDGTTLVNLTNNDKYYDAELYNGGSYIKFQNVMYVNMNWNINRLSGSGIISAQNNLGDFIDLVFRYFAPLGPSNFSYDIGYFFATCYPFITHVLMVDDLNTLSNPEEIFNVDGVNIDGGSPTAQIPLTDLLLHIKRLETDLPFPYPAIDPVPIKQIIINNTYNYNGDPSEDDDYQPAVITRVDQAYTDPISVDDGWFTSASEYIQYMWDMTKPVVEYTKDMLDVLTIENDDGNVSGLSLVIYASVTIGVAGGVLSKLLL